MAEPRDTQTAIDAAITDPFLASLVTRQNAYADANNGHYAQTLPNFITIPTRGDTTQPDGRTRKPSDMEEDWEDLVMPDLDTTCAMWFDVIQAEHQQDICLVRFGARVPGGLGSIIKTIYLLGPASLRQDSWADPRDRVGKGWQFIPAE